MKYSINHEEKYVLIRIEEDKLDSIQAPELKSAFLKLQSEGSNNVILDLSSVKYSDSSGLSALLVGNRIFTENGGVFILTGLNEHVKKLISISQLENVLYLLPTEHEAVEAVFMHELEKNLRDEAGEENE
ncbi:STAS domain-containing protein [Xanthovirga aplysinae]|uniref:STAS domain-containing protein n=1 Tax=Xanthovirga aplysinae TaxID=2529853 RepID=UPI0012BB644F|nr:STAS domain-containing protein [Xanthovirga aplysinae]MTI32379.1 anti-sigma factor antagonist [Xanthovirga aplysinae]